MAKKTVKPKATKPKASLYDTDYQRQASDLQKVLDEAGVNRKATEDEVAQYYGHQDKAAVADKYKDEKKAITTKVNKSKAELHKERKPIRQAALRAILAKDKHVTKKELVKYKEAAKTNARAKVSRTKDVQVTKNVAKTAAELKKERATASAAAIKKRLATLKSKGVKVDSARKAKVVANQTRKASAAVSAYRKTPQFAVTKKLVSKGNAGYSNDQGTYQKELAASAEKDRQNISEEAAQHGTVHSGVYLQKQADYNKEYQKQANEIENQKKSKYQAAARTYETAKSAVDLQRSNAAAAAARRKVLKAQGAV